MTCYEIFVMSCTKHQQCLCCVIQIHFSPPSSRCMPRWHPDFLLDELCKCIFFYCALISMRRELRQAGRQAGRELQSDPTESTELKELGLQRSNAIKYIYAAVNFSSFSEDCVLHYLTAFCWFSKSAIMQNQYLFLNCSFLKNICCMECCMHTVSESQFHSAVKLM